MKKILLFSLTTLSSFFLNAQVFWTPKSTSFASTARLVTQVSYSNTDPNIVWCTGGYVGATTPAPNVQEYSKSADGGNTWTAGAINIGAANAAQIIGSIEPINATTAFVASANSAGGPGGGVWITTNGGSTWTKQTTALFNEAASFADFVTFFSPTEGVALGDSVSSNALEIYRTTNGGVNWTRVPASNIPVASPAGEGCYTRIYKRLGDSIWAGSNSGRLYRTNDRGVTWSVAQTPLTDFGSAASNGAFAFRDATHGLLLTSGGECYETSDAGATWSAVIANSGSPRDGDVCWVPGTPNMYVCAGSDADGIFGSSYTIDGGLNWVDINLLGDTLNVNVAASVNFFDVANGLCSGRSNTSTTGIFKYVGTELQNALATNTFSNDKAFKAYPNPTSGLVALTGKNITNVVVTDVLGKQVSNTNYTLLSNVNLDLTAANAGLYLVKVTNNEGNVSTLKVVKQ
jgi:Secretion system C-terminal sorting domain